jgi:hypothetical protein
LSSIVTLPLATTTRVARWTDHGHEAVGDACERDALGLARHSIAGDRKIASRPSESQGRGPACGLAAGRCDQQIGERGLGERHGHGMLTGHPQERHQVRERAAHALEFLGHRNQRQAHLLDLLPEIARPHALLDSVHDVLAAALGEEAAGGLEQHVSGFAVHLASPSA